MGLMSSLHIGRSGLAVSQAALEVAGNNIANASTEGYSRRSATIKPSRSYEYAPGINMGTGVTLEAVVRHTDAALMGRLSTATSDQHAAIALADMLSQIEGIEQELTDQGLSTHLAEFFNTWSELASNPNDSSLKSLVVQKGKSLADMVQRMHRDMGTVRTQLDEGLRSDVQQVNALLDDIARVNAEIVSSDGGTGQANALRDQRDQLVQDLSEYIDVTTHEQPAGTLDVLIGSTPLVLAGGSRGLKAEFTSAGDDIKVQIRVRDDGELINPESGRLGALIEARDSNINDTIHAIDEFSESLIFHVNRVHSQGQAIQKFSEVTGTYYASDSSLSMSLEEAGLKFKPDHGSFELHVTQNSTNQRTTHRIAIDMDGIGGPNMSLDDLVAAIDAVNNVSASVTSAGQLKITSDSSDFSFSFANDSSGVLASLGVNTFFQGGSAGEMQINDRLLDDPTLLAIADDHTPGGNGTAVAMANLYDKPLDELTGMSLRQTWASHVEDLAIRNSTAKANVESANVIVESLRGQREAVSGVSLDEEAINMLSFQRAFQGSARFIQVVDELMQTMINLVR